MPNLDLDDRQHDASCGTTFDEEEDEASYDGEGERRSPENEAGALYDDIIGETQQLVDSQVSDLTSTSTPHQRAIYKNHTFE
jgi:hypothetical protein